MTRSDLVHKLVQASLAEVEMFNVLYPFMDRFEEGATGIGPAEIHEHWDAWDAATAVYDAARLALVDFDAVTTN